MLRRCGCHEHDIFRASFVFSPVTTEAIFRWEHSEAEQDGQTTEIVNGNLNLPGDAGTPGGLDARVAQYNALAGAYGFVPFNTEVKIRFLIFVALPEDVARKKCMKS